MDVQFFIGAIIILALVGAAYIVHRVINGKSVPFISKPQKPDDSIGNRHR